MTPPSEIVRAVPAEVADDRNLYRPSPFSYAETARSQQQVFVAGVVTQFGRHVDFGAPSLGDPLPTNPAEAPIALDV